VVKRIVSSAARILAASGLFAGRDDAADEAEVHHARCPRCQQKVRYGARRAGRSIRCPCCRRHWTLPATGEAAQVVPERRSA
jgi:hypothetical protein